MGKVRDSQGHHGFDADVRAAPKKKRARRPAAKKLTRAEAVFPKDFEVPKKQNRRSDPDVVERENKRAWELHRRILWAVAEAGLTGKELERLVDAGEGYLRNLEDAERPSRNPSFFTITLMAAHLGVSPFFLAQLTDYPYDFAGEKTENKRGGR